MTPKGPHIAEGDPHAVLQPLSWGSPCPRCPVVCGGSYSSSCCCAVVTEQLHCLSCCTWESFWADARGAYFPPEMTAVSVLHVQISAFIAGGRQRDGCVRSCVRGGEEERLQLQEARADCHPRSSKLSFSLSRKPCPGVSSRRFQQAGTDTRALPHGCCSAVFPQDPSPPACCEVCSSLPTLPFPGLTNQIINGRKGLPT